MPADVTNCFVIAASVLLAILIAFRAVKNITAHTNTVNATVSEKQITENFSKYSENGKHKKYAVTFLSEGKKLTFYVSEFSYNGYSIGDKGTLKYKGDRILEFR